jgi:uncharacterized protein (DUF302 family)
MTSYALTTVLPQAHAEAVAAVRAALAAAGFGILTEIDMQATMQLKLGEKIEPYLILGACNPPLAFRGLGVDRSLGLLLPCNVVVRSLGDTETIVEAVDPQTMVALTGNEELRPVADDATARLRRALDSLTVDVR